MNMWWKKSLINGCLFLTGKIYIVEMNALSTLLFPFQNIRLPPPTGLFFKIDTYYWDSCRKNRRPGVLYLLYLHLKSPNVLLYYQAAQLKCSMIHLSTNGIPHYTLDTRKVLKPSNRKNVILKTSHIYLKWLGVSIFVANIVWFMFWTLFLTDVLLKDWFETMYFRLIHDISK